MDAIDLLSVNVNDHTEKKNGLTYLSWAWAWDRVLRADPAATFEVKHCEGKPYQAVGDTAMVWTTVTIFGKPMTCMLPVMNSSNQPISIEGRSFKDKWGKEKTERVDAFNVNTAIMRCLTKAIALHGLGLYIYAGEDLPEEAGNAPEASNTSDAPNPSDKPKEAANTAPKVKKTMPPIPPIPPDDPNKLVNNQPKEWDESEPARELFTQLIIDQVGQCKTPAELDSLRDVNSLQIKGLTENFPDKLQRIKDAFINRRKAIKEN